MPGVQQRAVQHCLPALRPRTFHGFGHRAGSLISLAGCSDCSLEILLVHSIFQPSFSGVRRSCYSDHPGYRISTDIFRLPVGCSGKNLDPPSHILPRVRFKTSKRVQYMLFWFKSLKVFKISHQLDNIFQPRPVGGYRYCMRGRGGMLLNLK